MSSLLSVQPLFSGLVTKIIFLRENPQLDWKQMFDQMYSQSYMPVGNSTLI